MKFHLLLFFLGFFSLSSSTQTFKNGINYSYYEGCFNSTVDFINSQPLKYGRSLNFDLTQRDKDDCFGFQFQGEILIPSEDTYNFYTSSDDGSLLYVDGTLVVSNDGIHSNSENYGTISLDEGFHKIKVIYFERAGRENLHVKYSSSSIVKQLIPDSILFSEAHDFSGTISYKDSNIGVGTSKPDEKLTVNGNIHAEEVRVDLAVPAPDYVFEEEYNLTNLEELEKYISTNKHLPETPSARDFERDGISTGEMNMLLLKKVEELTLHLIDLNKQMKYLLKENQKLHKMESKQSSDN